MSGRHLTECGLPGMAHVPYGLHACHFYRDRAELVDALVPYFSAGLRNNERCLWIAAPPLPAAEAMAALEAAWPATRDALARGALRVLDFDHWYSDAAGLKGAEVAEYWIEEERRALAEGYSGLRITGNTSFLQRADWATFMEYESAVSARLHGRRIVALCSYVLRGRSSGEVDEVMRAHECTLERADTTWQVVAR